MQRLVWLIAGALMAALTVAPAARAADYQVRPGDVLAIEVLEDQSLNGSVLVAPDGRISVPLAGSLRAGGHSVDEIRQGVTAALGANFAAPPTVHVGLVSVAKVGEARGPSPIGVYIIGEVGAPGLVEVAPGTTLLQVLSLAGGFSDFAAVKRLQLRRLSGASGGERVWKINYEAMLDGRSRAGTARVEQGDVIVVPTRRLFE